jgi:hypothetical protein
MITTAANGHNGSQWSQQGNNRNQIALTRKQRRLVVHLRHDRPDGPHVDRDRVVPRAEQNLGRAVPQRHNLVRVPADTDTMAIIKKTGVYRCKT